MPQNNTLILLYLPEASAKVADASGTVWTTAWRDREVWMRFEPYRPQAYLTYVGGHKAKSAPRNRA